MTQRLLIFTVLLTGAVVAMGGCDRSASPEGTTSTQSAPVSSNADPSGKMATAVAVNGADLASAKPLHGLRCYLDRINADRASKGGFSISKGGQAIFHGWAVDAQRTAPTDVTVVLKGKQSWGLTTTAGVVRPDVAKALKSPAAERAGFRVTSTLDAVAPGRYQVIILTGQAGADSTLCDTHRHVQVNG